MHPAKLDKHLPPNHPVHTHFPSPLRPQENKVTP
jgi:hypothetical protein